MLGQRVPYRPRERSDHGAARTGLTDAEALVAKDRQSNGRGAVKTGLLGLARIVSRVEVGHSDRSHSAQLDYRLLVGPLVMVHALRKVHVTAGV